MRFVALVPNARVQEMIQESVASTLVLPILAFVNGRRAQAVAPQIIGGTVGGLAFALQVWVVISQTLPSCTLFDGCSASVAIFTGTSIVGRR